MNKKSLLCNLHIGQTFPPWKRLFFCRIVRKTSDVLKIKGRNDIITSKYIRHLIIEEDGVKKQKIHQMLIEEDQAWN